MYRKSLIRVAGRFAAAFVIAAALLPGVAGNVAADEDPNLPKPTIIADPNPPFGSTPNCVSVKWTAPSVPVGEQGIAGYSVERDNPAFEQDVGQLLQRNVCDQQPDTPANFKVCALWVSEEEDPVTSCSPWVSLSTTPAGIGEMEPSGPLPVPPVHPIQNPGTTEFGVEWGWKGTNAGHYYDYYNIRIAPEGGKAWEMKHDDDGNWGWQPVTNLTPATTYSVSVEGCDVDPIPYTNDNCSGWSAPQKVTTVGAYGPDTCKQGFVWRDAVPDDHICVTPERRQKVADDLNTANSRSPEIPMPEVSGGAPPIGGECNPLYYKGPRNRKGAPDPPLPGCNFFGTKICLEGYVPRDVPGENVNVCVTPQERDLIAQENANPQQNRVKPQ